MTLAYSAVGEVHLTRDGRQALAARAQNLRDEIIPGLVELRDGSERDNSVLTDYELATAELARVSALLANARPTDALVDDPQVVELGETVTVRTDDGASERYVIVHTSEVSVGSAAVSSQSPLGQALLGSRVGDEVDVPAPGGRYRCVITSAVRAESAPTDRDTMTACPNQDTTT